MRINPLLDEVALPEGFVDFDDFFDEMVDAETNSRLSDKRRELANNSLSWSGLKKLRLISGLSQKELAMRIGTSQPRLSIWESNPESMSTDTVRNLVRELSVSYDDFFEAVFND